MIRRLVTKKTVAAFLITAFFGVTLSAAEAAPSKKHEGYLYPSQQQNQQHSRPSVQKPRPTMQQPRPGSQRPTIQRPKPSSPRPTMQQPRPGSQRPTIQRPKPGSPRPTMQQPRPGSQRPTMHRPKPGLSRPTMHQPKPKETRSESLRPKIQQSKHDVAKPTVHEAKQNVTKPKVYEPKHDVTRPKMHEPKQKIVKPDMHRPKYWKHRKPGPRKDLLRPPVKRTYENMHVWRRAPKPPKDHWWNHRPAHRPGRYRGYYNGIYYSDVLSALLAAEIIHSTYITEPARVIYYEKDSASAFIPKEAIKYKGHHYLVFSDIGNSMEDAQQFCESIGGHLAAVGDDGKNDRLYRLINDSGYDNEYFEKFGHYRMIPGEPVTYVKADTDSSSGEEELFYGLYYWNYKNLRENGITDGTGGNAFVCEWDR